MYLGLSEPLSVDVFVYVLTIMPGPTEGKDALGTEVAESSEIPM